MKIFEINFLKGKAIEIMVRSDPKNVDDYYYKKVMYRIEGEIETRVK